MYKKFLILFILVLNCSYNTKTKNISSDEIVNVSEGDKSKEISEVPSNSLNSFSSVMDFFRIFNTILTMFISDKVPSKEKIMEGAIKGMMKSLDDPHSIYMSPEEYEHLITTHIDSSYEGGLGIHIIKIKEDNFILVVSIIKNTPAYGAKLKRGDKIVKVNDKDVKGLTANQCVSLMKGANGSSVNLTILRGAETFNLNVKRAKINIQHVEYEMLDKNIGYIKLSDFAKGVAKTIRENIKELEKKGAKYLILDLRDNPGGTLNDAIEVSSIFIEKSPIVIQEANKEKTNFDSTGNSLSIPLVVLINGGSASASEIVAGAIKDYKRGLLIGEKTYGKGTVQAVIPLSEKEKAGAIKLTIARWLTPKGILIDKTGISPDIFVGRDSSDLKHLLEFQEKGTVSGIEVMIKILEKVDESKAEQLNTARKIIKLMNGKNPIEFIN